MVLIEHGEGRPADACSGPRHSGYESRCHLGTATHRHRRHRGARNDEREHNDTGEALKDRRGSGSDDAGSDESARNAAGDDPCDARAVESVVFMAEHADGDRKAEDDDGHGQCLGERDRQHGHGDEIHAKPERALDGRPLLSQPRPPRRRPW